MSGPGAERRRDRATPAWRGLFSLAARRAAEDGWVRAARWLTLAITLTFGGLLVAVRLGTSAEAVDVLLERAIVAACWVGCGVALIGLGRDTDRRDEQDGILALVSQRGVSRAALARARCWGTAWVLFALLAPPLLGLATLQAALARSVRELVVSLALGGVVVAFSGVASVTLALLARAAARLHPARPRLTLLVLLLGPELFRSAGLAVPSVPTLLGAALVQAFAFATGVT